MKDTEIIKFIDNLYSRRDKCEKIKRIGLINKIKNIGLDIELTNKIKEITNGLSNDIFMDLDKI